MLLAGPLSPAKLAVLASLGLGTVEVRRRPIVAILSTGDELVAPGDALRPGQIHDANGPALAAAVTEAGGEPLPLPRVGDDPEAIERVLRGGAASADLVVTSGGVSVGRHDHVRAVLERHGSLDFWRIAVQPGKPLAVGELAGTTVIGLPGNPVSALVTFELFVRPFVRAMLGLDGDGRARVRAVVSMPIPKDPGRRAFLRVVVGRIRRRLRGPARGRAAVLAAATDGRCQRPPRRARGRRRRRAGHPLRGDRPRAALVKPSHLGDEGEPRMVDVGSKPVTARRAVAEASVRMRPDVLATLVDAGGPKGDAFVTARLAGIGAAKRTAELIPLCHPLPLDRVEVEVTPGRRVRRRRHPRRGWPRRPAPGSRWRR